MAGRIVVGTSGWTFDEWYPPKLPPRERLSYYAERFEGVEAVTREDLGYLRAHGRNAEGYLKGGSAAERFAWRYSRQELAEIAARARALAQQADHVRLMFGNGVHAPEAARRVRSILRQAPRRSAAVTSSRSL